jgi:predicted dehydrogenase
VAKAKAGKKDKSSSGKSSRKDAQELYDPFASPVDESAAVKRDAMVARAAKARAAKVAKSAGSSPKPLRGLLAAQQVISPLDRPDGPDAPVRARRGRPPGAANKASRDKASSPAVARATGASQRGTAPEAPDLLGIGIIGAGGIARGVHIPGYQKLPNAQVLAVSDPVQVSREGAAQQFGIEDAYEDFHEMLKRDDIHAVSVTTPNFLHAEATIAALEAGKHVLCEKPLAMNTREGEAMVEASRRTGCKLMCGFHYRFSPEVQTLKRFAEAGEFGEMYYARTQALRRRGIPGWGLFISKEKNGGGPLIDIGVHMLDSTMHVLGFPKPIAVSGKTWQMFGKRSDVMGLMGQWDHENFTVEDFAVAQVRFDNGAILTLESSFVANQEEADKMSFQIFGSEGGCGYNPLKMYKEQNRTLLDITPVHLPRNVQAHHEEIKHFVNAVVNDTPVLTPGEEALEITRIIDAIYESSETGKEVVF